MRIINLWNPFKFIFIFLFHSSQIIIWKLKYFPLIIVNIGSVFNEYKF